MLDKLIESRGHASEQRTIGGFMVSTGFIIISLLLTGVVYSLFSNNLTLGAEAFEISTLVAPVEPAVEPMPEAPPAPDQPQQESNNRDIKLPMRQNNIQRTNESPVNVPTSISVTRNESKARPNSAFILGNRDNDPINTRGNGRPKHPGNGIDPRGISVVPDINIKKPDEIPDPPVIKTPVVKEKKVISGGVVNGRAINLVVPNYPSSVRTLNIKGEVKVQVMIDENGRVISASAVSGHPLLRNSAVAAARASVFSPTTLSDQKVRVSGFIVYNFS